jgi:hypothetical protein
MRLKTIPEPLADVLQRHCNVNAFVKNWGERLRAELLDSRNVSKEDLFRSQLTEAIQYGTLTPEDYEDLTGEDFDTQEELQEWLCTIWREVYPDRPLPVRESVNWSSLRSGDR